MKMEVENKITLDNRIQKVGVVAKEALAELKKIQQKEKEIVKTGQEEIDSHIGGLLPGDVILYAGAPSSGKSEKLYKAIEKMMSVEVNSKADKYVSLEYSLEMKMLNKLLRKTHDLLNKKKTDILFEEFNEEEARKVNDYYLSLEDDRRYVVQTPVKPEEFYKMTRDFCILHKEKEGIFISIDHLLLFTGSDKQLVLEKVSEYINLLKLEFDNVYFILLSQLNRGYAAVIKDKSNDMIPTNALIFGSSFMEQLASYIVIITNPFKQNVTQYLKVSEDRYSYLSDFYGDSDNKGRVSFDTLGNLFLFVTKTRESDSAWKDLFITEMNLSEEQLEKMKQSVTENTPTIPDLQAPVFNTPIFEAPTLEPIFDMNVAFGEPEETDDKPF